MFLLTYIYSVIVGCMAYTTLIDKASFKVLLAPSSIFTLLYVSFIIMCKYIVVFVRKIRKKEKLAGKEICYLLISIAIPIIVYTIIMPMYDHLNPDSKNGIIYTLEMIVTSILVYISFMFMFLMALVMGLVSLNFLDYFPLICLGIIMWINFIILSKYFYRLIRKTIKKESLTKKETIYLIISTIIFFVQGILFTFIIKHA